MFVIVLVVFIFPVAIGVPALGVVIPPFVVGGVAMFAGFRKLVAGALGFGALIAMVLNGLVQFVIGLGDTLLAINVVIRAAGECAYGGKRDEGAANSAVFPR